MTMTLDEVKKYLTLRLERSWILDPIDDELNRRSIVAVESAIKEHERRLEMQNPNSDGAFICEPASDDEEQ